MRKKFLYITYSTLITTIIWICWNSKPASESIISNNENQTEFPNYNLMEQLVTLPTNINCLGSPFLVIIVTSYVGHVELRSAHRQAMPTSYLEKYNATRIFLLATIPRTEKFIKQEAIIDESNAFGDIVQGSFIENYRNLTYKHLMGLQWASKHCNTTRYILKVDDDTIFNLELTHKMLVAEKNVNPYNFLLGYMLNGTKPRRQGQNKWYVTWDEYEYTDYPPYLSGWYYITTPQVANRLCKIAAHHKYFWIDDILITGILTKSLGLKLKQLPDKFWLEYYELLECCLKDMILHDIKCNYVVGPNGGRNNLILEFNDAYRHCDKNKNCTEKALRSLKKECIAFSNRAIFSDGQSRVARIKL